MKSSTLKSCPFCGSDEAMMLPPTCNEESAYNPADRSHPFVRCMECYAEAVGSDWDHDGDSAIAAWNDRPHAEIARLTAKVENLTAALSPFARFSDYKAGSSAIGEVIRRKRAEMDAHNPVTWTINWSDDTTAALAQAREMAAFYSAHWYTTTGEEYPPCGTWPDDEMLRDTGRRAREWLERWAPKDEVMTDPKPCDGCGSTGIEINSVGQFGFAPADFWLRCMCCGMTAEARGSREEAIAAWNNRSEES